jgi:hypothetical protein
MRKFRLALAALIALLPGASLSGIAQALPIGPYSELRIGVGKLSTIHEAHYVWGGRAYCWHDSGWNGAGWYRCGYASRTGMGWGGPQGWHGWHWQGPDGPRHGGHHGPGHHYGPAGCCG